MMNILITGGAGQLGTTLQNILPSDSYTLIPLSKIQCDIRDRKSIENALNEYKPKWVINTAAYTAVDKAETEQQQAYDLNVKGAKLLAEECDRRKAKLVHFSTDYVFSGEKTQAYLESDICEPQSIYGNTKLLGEQAIQNTFDNYLILRVSWLFSSYGHNFFKTILRLLQERDSLKIVNDQHGCPTFTGHIAQVLRKIILENHSLVGLFHYCDQPSTTWFGFANYIQDCLLENKLQTKKEILAINTEEYPTPAKRPENSILNCAKIYHAAGITAYDWRDGVKKICGELQHA